MLSERGHDVALEEVARAAGVSRTTVFRNFRTREDLLAVVYSDNVSHIEYRSSELEGADDGVIQLLDFVFDMQLKDRALARMISSSEIELFAALAARTEKAFAPHVRRAREIQIVHADVEPADITLALSMSSGALAEIASYGDEGLTARVRRLLHRALFRENRP